MRIGMVLLAAACVLGVAGAVCADEEPAGNWFTRMFSGSAAKPAPEPVKSDPKTDLPAMPKLAPADRLKQARETLVRRQKVCLALRDIADQTDDNDLRQKVEVLEQRAFEIYCAATSFIRVPDRKGEDVDSKAPRPGQPSAKENR